MTVLDLSNVKKASQGESYTWRVKVGNVQASDLLVKGYLTLKLDISQADPGALQKTITTGNVVGTGQIENQGSAGTGIFRFDLTAAQMAALTARDYIYDIIAITAGGIRAQVDVGIFRVAQQITTSS